MDYLKCKLCGYKLKKKIKMFVDEYESEEYQLNKFIEHYEIDHPEYKLSSKNIEEYLEELL